MKHKRWRKGREQEERNKQSKRDYPSLQEKSMDNENQEQLPQESSEEGKPIEEQAREQTGQKRIQISFDERNLKTSYANGFRTAATAEEVLLDFGLNYVQPSGQRAGEAKIIFQANDRIVMNYYAAKRLAITLSQIVRRHEQQYGELELNAARRRSGRR
jgi:hypothetical protein